VSSTLAEQDFQQSVGQRLPACRVNHSDPYTVSCSLARSDRLLDLRAIEQSNSRSCLDWASVTVMDLEGVQISLVPDTSIQIQALDGDARGIYNGVNEGFDANVVDLNVEWINIVRAICLEIHIRNERREIVWVKSHERTGDHLHGKLV